MTNQDVILIEKLWKRLVEKPFSPREFVKQIRWHGGQDMLNLSEEDLLQLLERRFSGDWHEPAFSFSELLAKYSVPDKNRLKEEIVGWAFASFVISDAIKHEKAEWEMEFNNFMNCFAEVRDELEIEEIVQIFRRVFQ